ncbi:hypothetical protein NKH18_21580 [Streptomyces sp. M10(2022)]
MARVAEQAAASGPRTVLLAYRAGLVARYWEVGAGSCWSRCRTPPDTRRRPARPVAARPYGGL